MNVHLPPSRFPVLRVLRTAALAAALLSCPFTVSGQNYTASSNNSTSAITISSGNYTISVGSSGALTRSNAITLSGGTLQGGIMDNVATVSGLSGAGTSSTNVDANGVTIILRGNGTSATTANLTLASGITINGTNQLLVGGGAGGGGARATRNRGGGGGGGFVVLTTGNLSGTLALTAGGGSAGAAASGGATAAGGNSSIGATAVSGGGGAAAALQAPLVAPEALAAEGLAARPVMQQQARVVLAVVAVAVVAPPEPAGPGEPAAWRFNMPTTATWQPET